MEILIYPDAVAAARMAADFIAAQARDCLAANERFLLAVSGGSTPWLMLSELAQREVQWERVHLFQVDERVAPDGDPERNWTHLQQCLAPCWRRLEARVHPMPVNIPDLEAGAAQYATRLVQIAGPQPRLDLVHLGLGTDGHTASLLPNDPALQVRNRDVAITQTYRGYQRMTLTLPTINRARQILWLVAGADKRTALTRLLNGDADIPAAQINDANATVLADATAMGTST
jgi:6-phosphogluconolactonase